MGEHKSPLALLTCIDTTIGLVLFCFKSLLKPPLD